MQGFPSAATPDLADLPGDALRLGSVAFSPASAADPAFAAADAAVRSDEITPNRTRAVREDAMTLSAVSSPAAETQTHPLLKTIRERTVAFLRDIDNRENANAMHRAIIAAYGAGLSHGEIEAASDAALEDVRRV
jgi:predicted lipid-binding transport protein (Tim44 family)